MQRRASRFPPDSRQLARMLPPALARSMGQSGWVAGLCLFRTIRVVFYQQLAIDVFRDRTDLYANPNVWPSILEGLRSSEFFVLLASPEAGKSPWVCKEIDFWIANREPQKLLL